MATIESEFDWLIDYDPRADVVYYTFTVSDGPMPRFKRPRSFMRVMRLLIWNAMRSRLEGE